MRACLTGLHEQLQPEPCQTMVWEPASHVKPLLEPPVASTGVVKPVKRDSARLRELTIALPSTIAPKLCRNNHDFATPPTLQAPTGEKKKSAHHPPVPLLPAIQRGHESSPAAAAAGAQGGLPGHRNRRIHSGGGGSRRRRRRRVPVQGGGGSRRSCNGRGAR